MSENIEKGVGPFEQAVGDLTDLTGEERDIAIWNSALRWASENAHLEVVDEFTGEITEAKLESMDLMDEIYQVSKSSILSAMEGRTK